ncbi:uncharacterized protein EAF01_000643 [Botrytis porri]|uniref:N-acetyltransferase domain-containing protein n=1 Tax=Botrytis porri TaxID=87229 RepID=A0A4Z1KUR4_9HELO|nr:uncharacterized protein EAF01_000643 [Botrytis porri]KAF7914237.1 hypothetical protein EAF01_000643 [Botrytis porri]TGO88268.1 hypothetical protein BPOR_0173g00090 [Botrytis porri]
MKSNLQRLDFESEADFKEMMIACWEAFENPFNSYLRIVYYLKDDSPQERERSIQIATESAIRHHAQKSPNSHWMKIIEPMHGKLIGAANWIYFEGNSDTVNNANPVVALWWPEGIGREYANNFMRQIEAHKYYLHCNRPYLLLNIAFTIPGFRRKGAMKLVMDWGIERADELGVDTYVEASETGRLLYEKYGFMTYYKVVVNTSIEDPSSSWKDLEEKLSPEPQYFMWRPIKGKFEVGKTWLPWGTESFVPLVCETPN